MPVLRETPTAGFSDLVVDAEKRLPAICLKCAAKKHIVRRNERLVAATAVQGLGAVGGVCGVMVARSMRDDPVAGAVVLGASLLGSLAVGWIVHWQAPKVTLALPLCRACNDRWTTGVTVRWTILAIVSGAALAFGYGFFGHDPIGYGVGALLIAAIVALALATRLRDRFVHASAISGTRVVLKGVGLAACFAIAAKTKRAAR